jgi:hypothetical protein
VDLCSGSVGKEKWKDRFEPLDLGLNSQQSLDLSRGAQGLNPCKQSEVPKEFVLGYRHSGVRGSGGRESGYSTTKIMTR